MLLSLLNSREISLELAQRVQAERIGQKLTQRALSDRSGVALSTLRKFEQTGQVSLRAFLQLLLALGRVESLQDWLLPDAEASSLDELIDRQKPARRGPRT